MFSEREQQRYQRHLQLAGFGADGQQALKRAHVLVVGVGGLGCPASQYLAAAGVGTLTLVDGDSVSLSNLQRQVLFTEADLGRNKAETGAQRLRAMNGDISVHAVAQALDVDIAPGLIGVADIVLDCTDNFHSRYLVNDLCCELGKPWVYSSVLGFEGQLALFDTGKSCFRCLFPELVEVPDCNQAGVLGALPGLLGAAQALEAIKHLCGLSARDHNQLLTLSGLALGTRSINLSCDPACALCSGQSTYRDHLEDYRPMTTLNEIAAEEFASFVEEHDPLLIDVRPAEEHAAGNLGGINIPADELVASLGHTIPVEGERVILLYCLMGKRSAMAAVLLAEHEVPGVHCLAGGMNAQPN